MLVLHVLTQHCGNHHASTFHHHSLVTSISAAGLLLQLKFSVKDRLDLVSKGLKGSRRGRLGLVLQGSKGSQCAF